MLGTRNRGAISLAYEAKKMLPEQCPQRRNGQGRGGHIRQREGAQWLEISNSSCVCMKIALSAC